MQPARHRAPKSRPRSYDGKQREHIPRGRKHCECEGKLKDCPDCNRSGFRKLTDPERYF